MPSPLAGRIDFEVARAREWRDGSFTPVADPPAPSIADDSLAVDMVVDRAHRVLARDATSPGDLAARFVKLFATVVVVVATAAGAQLAVAVLGDPGEGPVNLIWLLIHALAAPTLFLILSLVLLMPRIPGLGWLRDSVGETLSLGYLLFGAAVRLANRGRANDRDASATRSAAIQRLRSLSPLRYLATTVSHGGWIGFHVGFLVAAGLVLSAQHHSFSWQSTFVSDAREATRALRALTFPAALWPGQPSELQVRVSRYVPDQARFADDAGDPSRALALRQVWSRQLLVTVAGFGLLPRVVMLLLSALLWHTASARLSPDEDDPYVIAVWKSLLPPVTTVTHSASPALTEAAPSARAETTPDDHGPPAAPVTPVSWFVAPFLSAARDSSSPVAALWGDRRSHWHDLPRLDGRTAEKRALATLAECEQRPVGVVLLCDYRTTPDASLARLARRIREAVGDDGQLTIALTGGGAFRSTRMGHEADGMQRRRQVWVDAVDGWGVASTAPFDFDVTTATPESRRQLAETLDVESTSSVSPTTQQSSFTRALDRIDDSVDGWLETLAAAGPDEVEATQLRLAALARYDVDRCFGVASEVGPGADSDPPRGLTSVLAKALGSEALDQRVLETAARSLGGMWSIVSRARDLDPKFVVAGLTAGLVAGPLGGAIAAGTSGLIAGASLATTLAALGGAAGGALSLSLAKLRGDDAAPIGSPVADPLGLPARTAVTRAIVLAHQGQPEPHISAVLGEVAKAAETTQVMSTIDDVRALTRVARERATP